MQVPLISIIIPVYKVAQYLDECVYSLVNQTYTNLEIILVDDGSPDECPQMCDNWAKKDARIKVIHKKNGGASTARNAALEVAKGDYIGFADSDDYCDRTMFAELVAALEQSNVGIACCGAYRIHMDGVICPMASETTKNIWNTEEAINAIFYSQADTAVWSKLFRKSLFDDIRFPEGEVNEEFPLLIPLIVKASGMINVGKNLYYYRERKGSVTNSTYLRGENAGIIYRNLCRMGRQLTEYQINCHEGFRFFSATFAFLTALSMEKRFPKLGENVKREYYNYREIMKENAWVFLCSAHSSTKDKILYILVMTRLLRPLYSVFYKSHL